MITFFSTEAATDTSFWMVNHLVCTNDTKVTKVSFVTVVWTSSDVDLDVIMGREDKSFDLAGKFESIDVTADAVVVTNTSGDISSTDCWVTGFWIPESWFASNLVHICTRKFCFNFSDVFFDVFVYCWDVIVVDTTDIECLTCSKVEVAITPCFSDVLNNA